jgi:hypothetical protein
LTIRVCTLWLPSGTTPASSTTGASVRNRRTVGELVPRATPLQVYGRLTARHGNALMLGFPASVAVNSARMGPPISALEAAIDIPAGSVVAGPELLNGPAQEICGAALNAAGSAKFAEVRACKKELSAAIPVELLD